MIMRKSIEGFFFLRKANLFLQIRSNTILQPKKEPESETSPSISNYGYFDITKVAYGQSNPNHTNSNTTSSVNIQDIPLKKVRVGDIDIAYKMFGKGEPILLIIGAGLNMDAWEPST